MNDGYYLLHGHESRELIPVEVHTIQMNPQPRQFVRGLRVTCTLRRAVELGYTFELLVRSSNLVEQTVSNLEYFEQDANDLEKVLNGEVKRLTTQLAKEEASNWPKQLRRIVDEINASVKGKQY